MSEISPATVDEVTLHAFRPPRILYYLVMLGLSGGIAAALGSWIYQKQMGMGVAGISYPVGWAVYIGNFVFWVGIAHSGTLISAILHLLRARWRTAVSRSAEAMTIFAVATAGLFPLIHLGRVWVVYYIIPYPSTRHLWPNFISPLVWDVLAVGTYFTVSVIFFYVGLIPDVAAARDRLVTQNTWRYKLCRTLALGWIGSGHQWLTHGRSFLYFAALATPLVVSVHSVVSWDFAMSMLSGWHTTIYAPYFVAGAIHSGLAMVLTLLIPMRRLLNLEKVITPQHFQAIALTMLATGSIVGYAYLVEPGIAWYSGSVFERQFVEWRAQGWFAFAYWTLPVLNVLVPATFILKPARESLSWLFAASILVNIGMWVERVHIVASATAHDYLPHTWSHYAPTWVEITITIGSFCFFFFLFFLFSRVLPPVAMSDTKEDNIFQKEFPPKRKHRRGARRIHRRDTGATAVFDSPEKLVKAVDALNQSPFDRFDYFSPMRIKELERITRRKHSPVRYWTFFGAIAGVIGGFALAIGAAKVNSLVVGGKPPVSIVPYCIVGFEGFILLGSISNLIGLLIHARLLTFQMPLWYNHRFSHDQFGVFAPIPAESVEEFARAVSVAEPLEVRYVG
ncbi:MAG: DUF3341 domain-containing protein [Candidatus Hydrogenedentes bacterium]|nr:DUF3341 domain-containing protein [Candidatus Hydrogenedentota bacterium]